MLNAYVYKHKQIIVNCQQKFCWAFCNLSKLSTGKKEGPIISQLVFTVGSFFFYSFRIFQRFLEETNKIEVKL
ncbi:MAG: hypothetical protein APR62_01320 [Smithella sp. SDB]|nr:MAG: hypothetical protein APR62_01320 [Smithella sp. SDB]